MARRAMLQIAYMAGEDDSIKIEWLAGYRHVPADELNTFIEKAVAALQELKTPEVAVPAPAPEPEPEPVVD